MFGNGVTTYIVLFTTSGAASWPRSTEVENVDTSVSRETFEALMLSSPLYLVLA